MKVPAIRMVFAAAVAALVSVPVAADEQQYRIAISSDPSSKASRPARSPKLTRALAVKPSVRQARVIPGAKTATYVRDTQGRIASVTDAKGTTQYTYFADGLIESVEYPNGSKDTYTHEDILADQAAVRAVQADMATAESAPGTADTRAAKFTARALESGDLAASSNRFLFTGYYFDVETGLYYANARYYDPTIGRFITQDPYLGDPMDPPSLHRYAYAHANPTRYIDPTGHAVYAFDGTWNSKDDPRFEKTNVARMAEAVDPGTRVVYQRGVGTGGFIDKWHGGGTGAGARSRINEAYSRLTNIYNGGAGEKVDRTIDILGFSRGSAEAREFANRINREGIPDLSSARTVTTYRESRGEIVRENKVVYDRHFKAKVRFLGVFDTVGSIGVPGTNLNPGYDLSIAPNVETVRHATARDEKRQGFPLSSAVDPANPGDPRIIEKPFPGVHSDVGGGYDDQLDPRALSWMVYEAKKAGVPIDQERLVESIRREGIPIGEKSHESRSWLEQQLNLPRQIYRYSNPPIGDQMPRDGNAKIVGEGHTAGTVQWQDAVKPPNPDNQ